MNHLRTFLMAASCLALMIFASGCEKKKITQNATNEEDVDWSEIRVLQCALEQHKFVFYEGQEPVKLYAERNYGRCNDPAKYEIKFRSSNEDVVSIDKDGLMTIKSLGWAKIYMQCDNYYGNYKDTAEVGVYIDYDPYFKPDVIENVDSDGDGEISLEEALSVQQLWLRRVYGNVKFTHMTNLKTIELLYSGFSHIDFSDNPKIENISINTSCEDLIVNLPNNPKLRIFDAETCVINNPIDFSHCPNIEEIYHCGNPLCDIIDFTSNKKLKKLRLTGYFQVNIIDLSACKDLTDLQIEKTDGVVYLSNETYQLYIDNNDKIDIDLLVTVQTK